MRAMTKANSLGMFTSGRMKFERYETSETRIRTCDSTAIVTARLRRARVIDGARAEDDWRFTKVYLHRDDATFAAAVDDALESMHVRVRKTPARQGGSAPSSSRRAGGRKAIWPPADNFLRRTGATLALTSEGSWFNVVT
jgi:hypothetical protein